MVTYIRSDLDFILAQIKISEDHSLFEQSGGQDGKPLFGGPDASIPANNVSWGLRTVDGTYNNLIPGRTSWGAADQPFPDLLDPDYRPTDETFDPDGPGEAPAMGAPNYNPTPNSPDALVVDSTPRTISNLIVDQSPENPAAIHKALDLMGFEGDRTTILSDIAAAVDVYQAAGRTPAALAVLQAEVTSHGIEMAGPNIVLPNVSPDEGLSASFNSWFTLFGQFFDHGLDLVGKGQSGTVFIPLQPDDPLYVEGSPTNFMVLTRATVDNQGRTTNITTPFVDQNQTYTSHASHQVFLREYRMTDDGPVATGNALDGANGGLPTWAEVKAQARDMLGIDLTDFHVGNLPLLATDRYGNFIPDPDTGFPQVVMLPVSQPPNLASGTDENPLTIVNETTGEHLAVRTGHAFLDDIAHEAVPLGKIADGDIEIGLGNVPGDPNPPDPDAEYDNELLDAHFITGDGRGNENIGLTAVHTVFHAEHNRLVQHTKDVVLAEAANDIDFLNEWLLEPVASIPANVDDLQWNGERLFQAAKFGTEMQYQHLVFEEFARKIQPNIDVFLVPQGYDATVNPAIVAEFAHVVYRFGHSMLTESIDRFDADFNADHIGLIQGFLNPTEFLNGGTAEEATGAIVRGMTRQVGNEIDEFVTGALRNNLLGLPLDLATINMARGRDTGVPSLNAARREFYDVTNGNSELRPYDSWVDFASAIKNPAAIVNFIAAYGLHELITSETTIEGKRDAALAIITGQTVNGIEAPADALEFLNSNGGIWETAPGAATNTGLDNVDLWVGGLAEKNMPFGGMLGSTFNFVFEIQMEKLQNSDRFYYLQRLDGLHLFGEMEANSFSAMIMRNTDAIHLPSDVFSTPGLILEVIQSRQYNVINGVGTSADPNGGAILVPDVIRNNPATPGADNNYLRYTGGEHVVLGGSDNADILIAGIGDDTIHGDAGNDKIEGGFGNDIINGGAGNDIITDAGGDDNIKGGDGDDVINAGQGLNLTLGGAGNDFIVAGSDGGSEVFGGTGDDFILGSRTTERILGNEGNDWIEIGTFDGAPGDNFDEIFAGDSVLGHDVFLGDGSTDEFIGEGGDDIFVGSAGINKLEGMSGYDWATYKTTEPNGLAGVYADLLLNAFDEFPLPPDQATLDQYGNVEGLSGSAFNDILLGSDVTAADMPTEGNYRIGTNLIGSILSAAGIERIAGLDALLQNGVKRGDGGFDGGNIILGGAGSDRINGRGGDDVIDGDKWLDVQIRLDPTTGPVEFHNSMTTLVARMFAGTINASQLSVVRSIKTAASNGDLDTAVYSGNIADYDIVQLGNGVLRVTDNEPGDPDAVGLTADDGEDTLYNIERLEFADGVYINNTAAQGQPLISEADNSLTLGAVSPTETQLLTASPGNIEDPNGLSNPNFTYTWQRSATGTAAGPWTDVGTGVNYAPGALDVGFYLRVVATFTDDLGQIESRASDATIIVGDFYNGTNGANFYGAGQGANAGSNLVFGNGGADNLSTLGGNDVIDGGAGNDILNGGAGDDTVIGGIGNDQLDGGLGDDTMTGGVGNDTYNDVEAGDTVVENAADLGTDTVTTLLTAYTLGAGVENLTYTGTLAFEGTGNGANNRIQSGSGNDILDGGAGVDTMIGGSGDDTYHVNVSTDVVTEAGAGGGTDTVIATATDTLSANVENLIIGGAGNTGGTGNVLDNTMTGNGGNNALSGAGGNDTISGGEGADTLNGGAGDDTMNGDAGDDVLTGAGGVDTFNGGAGNDTLVGGAGNDFFVFQAGFGSDEITSFDAVGGPTAHDWIDLASYELGGSPEAFEAIVDIVQDGSDTLVTIGADTIRLVGVTATNVDAGDFVTL